MKNHMPDWYNRLVKKRKDESENRKEILNLIRELQEDETPGRNSALLGNR